MNSFNEFKAADFGSQFLNSARKLPLARLHLAPERFLGSSKLGKMVAIAESASENTQSLCSVLPPPQLALLCGHVRGPPPSPPRWRSRPRAAAEPRRAQQVCSQPKAAHGRRLPPRPKTLPCSVAFEGAPPGARPKPAGRTNDQSKEQSEASTPGYATTTGHATAVTLTRHAQHHTTPHQGRDEQEDLADPHSGPFVKPL